MSEPRTDRATRYAFSHPLPRPVHDEVSERLAANRRAFGIATTASTIEQVIACLALRGYVVVDVDDLEPERGGTE